MLLVSCARRNLVGGDVLFVVEGDRLALARAPLGALRAYSGRKRVSLSPGWGSKRSLVCIMIVM